MPEQFSENVHFNFFSTRHTVFISYKIKLQVLGPLMVYGFIKASCAQVIAYIDKLAFGRATLIHTLYARCKSFLIAIDPCCFSRY